MKFGAVILMAALLAFSAFAGARVVVSSLPEAVRPLAEVETNVFFDAGVATDNKWMLTIERDAAASNSVEVVFGRDANEDGVLGIEEGELLVGWDCGEWLWRDRRANAACRIEVSPADYPDENIVWSCEPAGIAEVLGDGTGRAVTVRGISEGEATLSVQIGDCRSHPPTFPLHVVPIATVNLRAWIIEGNDGKRAFEPEDVRRMVKDANDVYAQVGVTLNLIEPIVTTNIPDAYNALCNPSTNQTSNWTYWNIVDIATNTCGLECYFINRFIDEEDTKAANSDYGLVVTVKATRYTLAHEIGHAFGMCDVYVSNLQQKDAADPLVELLPSEKASFSRLANDWNGGCDGSGSGGTRYYRSGTSMEQIVGCMLMLGEVPEGDARRDITAGCVYGVYGTNGVDQVKIWLKGDVPVGFPWGNRHPVHQ